MNINAGTNQYNLSLKKMKEEKRPTFATIFDKLDARSKKLNPKNPLNAVMTNDQMYRYYLEETEPMLREIPDDYDLLDDVIGGKSLKDMKLSEFAKLLSGDLDGDRNVKYETLVATITPTPAAPIIPAMISIASPPTPPASSASAPSAPIIPAPSSSVASSIAAPVAVSGLVPSGTGSAPATAPAPSAPIIPAPSSLVASSIAAPVAVSGLMPASSAGTAPANIKDIKDFLDVMSVDYTTPLTPRTSKMVSDLYGVDPNSILFPAPPPAAGSGGSGTGGRGLTISTAPIAGLTGLLSAASPASLARASATAIGSAISSVISPKPSPSGASIPPSAVASAATTIVPTPTPASSIPTAPLSPTNTGAVAGAVGGAVVDTGGYTDRDRISAFSRAIAAGLPAPRIPVSTTKTISKDENMIKYAIELSKYNTGLTDKKYSIKPTTAIGKMITTYERLNKRGASEENIIKEIKSGK